jgi:uncharacterized protein YkwD
MKQIILLAISLIALCSLSACSSGVSQEQYDNINEALNAAESQITELQGQLTAVEAQKVALQTQYDAIQNELSTLQSSPSELQQQYNELKASYDDAINNYDALNVDYDKLNSKFEALQNEYTALSIQGTSTPIEQAVEQQIFSLINERRAANDLNELIWGPNLYTWAMENSRNMAKDGEIEYSSYGSYQEVDWATGYNSAEVMANAMLTVWEKGNQYDRKFLNVGMLYGTVAVYKEGDIYYITYIADVFK